MGPVIYCMSWGVNLGLIWQLSITCLSLIHVTLTKQRDYIIHNILFSHLLYEPDMQLKCNNGQILGLYVPYTVD